MNILNNYDFFFNQLKKETKLNNQIMEVFDEYGITKHIYNFVQKQNPMFKILMKLHPEITTCGLIPSCLTELLKENKIILKKKDKK